MNIKKKICTRAAVSLFYIIMLTAGSLQAWELTDVLLFHASLENTLKADYAAGEAGCITAANLQEKIEYVPGVKGMATKGYISYPTEGNILTEKGTVLFWAQPVTWYADDGHPVNFFNTGHGMRDGKSASALQLYKYPSVNPAHSAQMWINNKLNIFAARGEEVDGKFVSRADNKLPVDISLWEKGGWHHLAFSWEKSTGLVKLYVDGFLIGTERMPLPDWFTDRFHIGDPEHLTVFDEVRIYNRPLMLDEIRSILMADKLG